MSVALIYKCDLCGTQTDKVLGFEAGPVMADGSRVRRTVDDPSTSTVHICYLCRQVVAREWNGK